MTPAPPSTFDKEALAKEILGTRVAIDEAEAGVKALKQRETELRAEWLARYAEDAATAQYDAGDSNYISFVAKTSRKAVDEAFLRAQLVEDAHVQAILTDPSRLKGPITKKLMVDKLGAERANALWNSQDLVVDGGKEVKVSIGNKAKLARTFAVMAGDTATDGNDAAVSAAPNPKRGRAGSMLRGSSAAVKSDDLVEAAARRAKVGAQLQALVE